MPNIRSHQYRAEQYVRSIGSYATGMDPNVIVAGVKPEPWWLDELVAGERAIRQFRTVVQAMLDETPRTCVRCRTPIAGRSDRRFCSDACRIKAHRSSSEDQVRTGGFLNR